VSTGEPTVGWRTLASLDMQLTQTGYPREEESGWPFMLNAEDRSAQ